MKNIFADANIDELMKSDHLLLRLLVYLSTEDDVDVILDHQVHIPECIFALHVSNQSKQYDVKKVNYSYNGCMHIYMYRIEGNFRRLNFRKIISENNFEKIFLKHCDIIYIAIIAT